MGLERKLRIHCLQLWFDLSDPGGGRGAVRLVDDVLVRRHRPGHEPVPDETRVMRFRHLLEAHQLGVRIFEEVSRVLLKRGLRLSKVTIVDATIIAAPSSTKNAEGSRDPADAPAEEGKQWHFGRRMSVSMPRAKCSTRW